MIAVLVYPLPSWPAAIYALFAMTVFWGGWHAAIWAHETPKPQPWQWRPYRGRHTGPVIPWDAANYGRHAKPAHPDGTPVETLAEVAA